MDIQQATKITQLTQENEQLEIQLNNLFNIMSLTSELTQSLELSEVYRNILDILVVSVGSHRHSIVLIDNAGVLKVIASKFGDDEVDFEHAVMDKGIIGKILENREVFVSEDIFDETLNDTIACIPLLTEEKLIGLIIIHKLLSHKKAFTEEDKELFQVLSTQAGYAISAALSYEKTKEEVETKDREITKLYDISSLVNLAVDINEILTITIDTIQDLLVCDIVAIFLYSEERNTLVLRETMGLDPEMLETYTIEPGEGVTGKAYREKKPILIKNMAHEVRYINLVKTKEAALYSGSLLTVPIMVKDSPIGVITVSKFKGGKLLDVPEKKLLTTLAAQIAIGLDNASLYEKQEKELIKVSSLFIATNQLHSTMDLNEIYRIANELLVDFVGAKTFAIFFKNPTEENLNIVLSRGIEKQIADSVQIPVGEGLIGKSVEDNESFVLENGETPPTIQLQGKEFPLYASIPLRLENKTVGAIVINELLAQKSNFVTFDRELFDLMAEHTAIAILRAQLFAKAEQQTTSSYDLSRLLTLDSDLKNSLKTLLTLVHQNFIDPIKSAVLIFEENNKGYTILAYKGFTASELEEINLLETEDVSGFSLHYNTSEVGKLFVEQKSGKKISQAEQKKLSTIVTLLSKFIYHDKNFQLSKNLAVLLNKEKSQSDAIVHGVSDGLLVTDMKNNIMLVNPMIENIFNFKEKDAIGNNIEKVIVYKEIKDLLYATLKNEVSETTLDIHHEGSFTALTIKSSLVKNDKDIPVGVVTIMHDVTKEKEADRVKDEFLKKFKQLSITDALTNLYNRGYFDKRIGEEFTKSQRYKRNFSIIMLDIDHFKTVNDTYGHKAGDAILIAVAKILKDCVRGIDMVARYGGEEFVIILPETLASSAYMVAERIRKTIEEKSFDTEGTTLQMTVSLGIAQSLNDVVSSPDDLVKRADAALYKAKDTGRNRIVTSSDV